MILKQVDYLGNSAPQRSLLLLRKLENIELSEFQKDRYHFLLATNYLTLGQLQKAQKHIEKVTKTHPLNDIGFRALKTSLTIYVAMSDWANALLTVQNIKESTDKQLNINRNILDQLKLAMLIFYNHIQEYDLAMQLADSLLEGGTSLRVKCIANTERLFSYVKTSPGKLKPNDFYKAITLCKETGDLIIEKVGYGFLAEYFLATEQPSKALEVLTSNLNSAKSTQYQALIAGYYELIAQGYLATQSYSDAEKYAKILVDTEQQHQYRQTITTAYQVLAAVAEQNKRYDEALSYYKKYSQAQQLNLDQDNAILLAIQKAEFDAVEKGTKIAILDKENKLLRTKVLLDEESAQSRRLALGLLSMALVVFILWAYKNRKIYLRMRYFAETDELTGISNRHHFAQLSISAIKLCQRTAQPVSFIIFDLDHFKKINDSYGHLAGDEALKMAVTAAKSCCRRNDAIGRLGGEEFGILLPGCGKHLASHIAEKCRKAIEKVNPEASGGKFTLTASFGVADSSVCGYEFTKLFAGADRALYQSKDLGRNQVFNYQANLFAYEI